MVEPFEERCLLFPQCWPLMPLAWYENYIIIWFRKDNAITNLAFFWRTQLLKVMWEVCGRFPASSEETGKRRERSALASTPSKAGCTGCKGRKEPRPSG